MRIDIMTLFPEMCEAVLDTSILGRARRAGLFEVHCHNIREYSKRSIRRWRRPFGGGSGMILRADPIFRCYEHVCAELCSKPHTIYLSPKGPVLTQQKAVALSKITTIFC
jgi:tRNA (guanine37-N1)-methyltransferase